MEVSRREFIQISGVVAAGALVAPGVALAEAPIEAAPEMLTGTVSGITPGSMVGIFRVIGPNNEIDGKNPLYLGEAKESEVSFQAVESGEVMVRVRKVTKIPFETTVDLTEEGTRVEAVQLHDHIALPS